LHFAIDKEVERVSITKTKKIYQYYCSICNQELIQKNCISKKTRFFN